MLASETLACDKNIKPIAVSGPWQMCIPLPRVPSMLYPPCLLPGSRSFPNISILAPNVTSSEKPQAHSSPQPYFIDTLIIYIIIYLHNYIIIYVHHFLFTCLFILCLLG